VTTFAGTAGSTGAADGTGAAASFNHPLGLTADASGNIYVADTVNRAIRMITPAAVVTTVAVNATLQSPRGVAADPVGNLYVTDETVVRKIAPGGAVTALASGFTEATGIALDSQGNVYVTDYASSSNSVCKIATDGTVTTVAAGLIYAFGVAVDAAGNLYVSCAGNDGTAVVGTSNTIQRISPGGVATVLAGSGGVIGSDDGFGVAAQFGDARGIALDGSGDLLRHFFDLRPAR
jgi:sugar lactone lactonase YvrE